MLRKWKKSILPWTGIGLGSLLLIGGIKILCCRIHLDKNPSMLGQRISGIDSLAFSSGISHGEYLEANALVLTPELQKSGQEKFLENCAVCHGPKGWGDGAAARGLSVTPSSYHSSNSLHLSEGEIFATITHGKGFMPSFQKKLSAQERWTIISYIRILQADSSRPSS